MGRVYKAEFRHEAVRLALSSGLSRERIAQDLGIGSSTLKKWIRDAQKLDTVVADTTDHTALLRENERLRRENLLLREERELLKRRHSSSRAKGREVCLYCSLSWAPFTRTGLPSVWCQRPGFQGLATTPGLCPQKTG